MTNFTCTGLTSATQPGEYAARKPTPMPIKTHAKPLTDCDTYQEIGDAFHISRQRVDQIVSSSLRWIWRSQVLARRQNKTLEQVSQKRLNNILAQKTRLEKSP